LNQSKWVSNASWEVLIEFVIAIRFAWLSEWLRHDDLEMIALETVYMNLLTDNADMLKKVLIPHEAKQEPHDETMLQLRR
jgi:homoserine kinase type II